MGGKSLNRDYCNHHLSFYIRKSFDEAIQELQELAREHSNYDFDEVVISVSLGRIFEATIKYP